MNLGMFILEFIFYRALCTSCTWVAISFPMLGKFLSTISSDIFLHPFFFSFSSGIPIFQMLMCLMLSQRPLRLFSFIFILFSLFYSMAVIFTTLYSNSFIYSSASVILLLISYNAFLNFYYCVIHLFLSLL